MPDRRDHSQPCYSIGHVYANVLMIRCDHLGSYSIEGRVWAGDGADDTVRLWQETWEGGPFDDARDIHRAVRELSEETIRQLMIARARA